MTVANVGASADNVFTTSVANAASLSGHVLVSCRAGPPGPPSGGPLPGACSGWAQRSGGRRGPSQPLLLAPARLGPRGGGRCLRTPRPACCLLPVPLQVPLARGVPVVPQPSHAPCARGPPTPSRSARRPRPQSLLWPFTAKAFRDLGAQPVSRVRAGVAVPRKWTVPGALAGLLRFPSASMAQLGHKAPDGKVLVFRTATNKTPVNHRGGGGRRARGPCECEGFVRAGHSRAGGFLPVAPPWQQVPPCQSVSQDRGPGEGCACSPCLGGGCPQARAGRDTPSQWRAAGLSVRLRRGGLPGLWAPARVRAVGAPQRYGELPLDP